MISTACCQLRGGRGPGDKGDSEDSQAFCDTDWFSSSGSGVGGSDGLSRRAISSSAAVSPDSTLDATGLLCPLPVLKARRALKAVPAGGILEVLATDPGATKDFEHFCQTTGCELVEASEQPGGILRFRLRKPG